jgi:enterobacterial common antigen flippase
LSEAAIPETIQNGSAPVIPADQPKAEEKTYGQILKSSALVGGAQALNILIGMVRTKVMAMLLGPAGMGLFGLYGSIADLAQSIGGMGVSSSGVRQIAEAVGSNDLVRIARTVTVLRRVSFLLGVVGTVLLIALSHPVSLLTFGSDRYAAAVSLLSIAVFFRLVSVGQGAVIQGMRRISDLAKMGVLGAAFGTVTSISLVYFLREKGIVPSLIVVAVLTLMCSWWYSRKIPLPSPSMNASQIGQEAAALLKLGFAFMTSALMMMGSAYAVRIIVFHKIGFEATGLYQSAWTLGGLYVGMILQAMAADFYPRLAASARDNIACNRLVNEQATVGLLLAGPGIIATLTFAPIVLTLFYSSKFAGAIDVLRWICVGVALRVITWPMGFIIVAKGEQGFFFWSELAWTVVNIGLTWIFVGSFGVSGAGIAFFGSYVFHGLLIYSIVRRLSHFRWSSENQKTAFFFFASIVVVFCGFSILPFPVAAGLGVLAAIFSCAYSIRAFLTMFSWDQIPRPLNQVLGRFGLRPRTADRLS